MSYLQCDICLNTFRTNTDVTQYLEDGLVICNCCKGEYHGVMDEDLNE